MRGPTAGCDQPIPVPRELTLLLAASVQRFGADQMLTGGIGRPVRPQIVERAVRDVRGSIERLP